MIKVTMYIDGEGNYTGFKSEGHAEDAAHGKSLVCAGVSTAVFGAYYFIKYGTVAQLNMQSDLGALSIQLKSPNHDASVALRQLISTIEMVKAEYGGIEIINKRGEYGH